MKKIIILLVALIIPSFIFAQDRTEKRVELKNGTVLTGFVEIQKDGSCILETSSGDVFFYSPSEVSRILTIPKVVQVPQIGTNNSGRTVYRDKGTIKFIDSGMELTSNDFLNFQDWDKYESAQIKRKTGNVMMIAGGAVFVVSGGVVAMGLLCDLEILPEISFGVATGIAAPAIIVGLINSCVGNRQLKMIEKQYNQHPGYVLDFGVHENGVGFALKF